MTYGGRVAKDASAKPYKALALDLVGNAHRRHDKAVEAGLSSHNRIEKTEQARPNIGGDMKAAYEAGLARQAFEPQRGAIETVLDAAFERLKQAADVIADHLRAIAEGIRTRTDPRTPDPEQDTPAPANRPSLSPGPCRCRSGFSSQLPSDVGRRG